MPKLLKIDAGGPRLTMLPMNEQHWPAIDKSKPPYTALNHSGAVPMRCGDWLDAKAMPPCVIYGRKVDENCRTLPGQAPLPDVLVARGGSLQYKTLVVSDRFKELLERMDPVAAQFFEVGFIHFAQGPVTDYEGRWWLLNFLKFHDSIDEAKSNRHWLEGYARGTEQSDPVLVAAPGIPDENAFWCGMDARRFKREECPEAGVIYREPPLDLNRGVDTYCSDAFYEAARAEGLDFCDGAWSLEAPSAPAALGSPDNLSHTLRYTGALAYQLAPMFSSVLKGTRPDTLRAHERLRTAISELQTDEPEGGPPEFSYRSEEHGYHQAPPAIFWGGGGTGICVSEEARSEIERLEPGVHRFVPFELIDIGPATLGRHRYYVFCCGQNINAVIGAASPDVHTDHGDRIVLDALVVAGRHFWQSETRPLQQEYLITSSEAFRALRRRETEGIGFQRTMKIARMEHVSNGRK